jgi:hypothetical protein
MMSRGALGWVVLVVVLLVPVAGFLKWRAGIDNPRHGGPVLLRASSMPFPKSDNTAPNPHTVAGAQVQKNQSTNSISNSGGGPKSDLAVPISSATTLSAPRAASAPVSNAAAPMASNVNQTAPSVSSSTASGYNPKTDRDPTLSPKEYDDIKKARLKLLQGQNRAYRIEDHIKLDGILATSEKVNAIVNGKLVEEGDTVSGVRIQRISVNCVYFDHKGHTYKICIKS